MNTSLYSLFQVTMRRWKLLLSVFLLVVLVAVLITTLTPSRYRATLQIYIGASQASNNTTFQYQGGLLSQQRVASYLELLQSAAVTGPVVQQLGLSQTPTQLASTVTATAVPDTVVIDLSVTSGTAAEAASRTNSVAESFVRLVANLETPPDAGGQAAVYARVVQPAAVPDAREAPSWSFNLSVGILGGLLLGLAVAFAVSALDRSLKSVADVGAEVSAVVLGQLPVDGTTSSNALPVVDDPGSSYAESIRRIRANMNYAVVGEATSVVVVTSSLPGEGKSTTARNLAASLANGGASVILVEADLRRPSLADSLNADPVAGLSEVLVQRATWQNSVSHIGRGNFDAIFSGSLPPNPSELLASENMVDLLRALRASYDTVIIDTPPLLPVSDSIPLITSAELTLVVCRKDKTKLDELKATVDTVRRVTEKPFGIVVNRAPGKNSAYGGYQRYGLPGVTSHSADRSPSDAGKSPRPSPRRRTNDAETTDLIRRPN